MPDARDVAGHLRAMQELQTSALAAAEFSDQFPAHPTTMTAARLTALSLARAHGRVTKATRHLSYLLQHAVSADVWALPDAQPVDPAAVYGAASTELRRTAGQLRIDADHLASAGVSAVPAKPRRSAALSVTQRLRRVLPGHRADPLPIAALPRSSAPAPRR
ncbi:hypothetical protein [Kitasatospora sp. NPDC050463]|uniref:hypothetical protein n=1 Tax=Kitasatospora sp. NPDC050463 TaxID=3155786 RepID=UPI00340C39AC